MADGKRSDYDSFMIRIWHGAGGDRLLRAEVDHIQTGAVYVGREVPEDWIEQTVRASIRSRAGHGNDDNHDDASPASAEDPRNAV